MWTKKPATLPQTEHGAPQTRRRQLEREARLQAAARRRIWRRLLRWGGIAAVLGVVFVGGYFYFSLGSSRPADARIQLVAGSTAPDFELPSTAGNPVRLSDLKSKNVLLFFQEGVMCPPCWQQMRDLQRDAAKLDALNVALVTITVDPLPLLVENAARERVAGMTLLYDEQARISSAYDAVYVSMHPGERPGHTFVLVDPSGVIRWRQDFHEMYVPNDRVLGPVTRALERA